MNDPNMFSGFDSQAFDFLDAVTLMSFAITLANRKVLLDQTTNSELMHELRMQDQRYLEKLLEQNSTIISQNKEILAILRESSGIDSAQST